MSDIKHTCDPQTEYGCHCELSQQVLSLEAKVKEWQDAYDRKKAQIEAIKSTMGSYATMVDLFCDEEEKNAALTRHLGEVRHAHAVKELALLRLVEVLGLNTENENKLMLRSDWAKEAVTLVGHQLWEIKRLVDACREALAEVEMGGANEHLTKASVILSEAIKPPTPAAREER